MAARHRKRLALRLTLRRRARRTTAFALPLLLLGAMLSAIGLLNAGPAAAATNNTCHYGTGGTDASGLCWLDFTGYSDSTALGAGQQFTQAIPGGYTMSFTVTRTATTGTPPVAAHITPTWSGTPFGGNGGQYTGIAGNPALYAQGTFSTTQHNGSWTVTLSDIQITDSAGQPMTGWTLNAADAESTNLHERLTFTTNGGGWQIVNRIPPISPGAQACNNGLTGAGSTTLVCTGSGSGSNVGDVVASTSGAPSTITAKAEQNFDLAAGAGGQSGVAFAVGTANITLAKTVTGRIQPSDQFALSNTNQNGTVVGSAATTGAATSATTGAITVLPGSPYSLTESAAGTALLSNYTQSWSCANSTSGSGTTLPNGSTLPASVTPAEGDNITCTLTNTAKPVSLSLAKHAATPVDVNGDGLTDAGDTIIYTFTVTNTGQLALSNIAVTDAKVGAVTCPPGPLAPGDATTCTADNPYTITATDQSSGAVDNTATASGTPPGSTVPVPSNPSSTHTPTTAPAPAITIVKSAAPSDAAQFTVGQVITYTFLVTNTGNVTLSPVTVNEGAFSGSGAMSAVSCPAGAASLAPGAQVACTATYTVTQADVDAGSVTNDATATGTPPSGPPVDSPPSTVTVPGDQTPAITIAKSADPTTIHHAGDTVTYSFLVTNTGNVTLTDVTVDETAFSGTGTPPTVTCPAGADSLAPGAAVTCTATYTATQADLDTGTITNTATATGTPPGSLTPPVSPPSSATVTAPPAPAVTIVKSADPSDAAGFTVGQVITYSFLVTNTGNVTLSPVAVDEGAFSGSGTMSPISCPAGADSLSPGASVTCTATYTITQTDVDAGSITNDATATGTPPTGPPVESPPSTVTIPGDPQPGISVTKSADVTTITAPGQTVTYSFLVTNTGNVTLTDVTVDEGAFTGTGAMSPISCPAAADSLAPGAQVTCTATYTTTQADVDAGALTNTATATGTPPSGPPPTSPPSTVTIPAPPAPELTIVKTADPTTVGNVGDLITYSFLITNTGNVTLTDVTVDEGAFTGTGDLSPAVCPAGADSVAPGASVTCTATYHLTQADVDAGSVTNTATATGTPPSGPPPTSPPSTVTVPVTPAPGIAVVKSADPSDAGHFTVGQVITYSFVATNTGNVTLTDVTIGEGTFTGSGALPPVTCPAGAAALAPGAQVTCTATYTVTQADVDAGSITNDAAATGTPPTGPPVESPPSTVTVPGEQSPAVTIVKSVTPATAGAAGDTVTYSFLVTNTGNVTLAPVVVNEGAFSGTGTLSPVTCPAGAASVAPGASVTCTATYTLTQADVNAGSVTNTATATGTPPSGPPVDSPPSTTTVTVPPAPAITVVKSANPATVGTVGDVVTYTFLMTNTGNVPLTDAHPTDGAFTGTGTLSAITCDAAAAALEPGQQSTCTATYTLTQADVDNGSVTNTATATGTPPTGPPPTSPPSTTTITATPDPSLTIAKSADPITVTAAGQTVTYSFVVTNTGNVTLSDVGVTETAFSGAGTMSAITCPSATLAPTAFETCTATYQVTQADIDAGTVTNTATAHGTPPNSGTPVDSPPDSATVTAPPTPAVTIVKSAVPDLPGDFTAGRTITYSFVVTNTGNVTLAPVVVNEGTFTGTGTLSPVTCPAGAAALAPGAQVTCTATYTVTQADVDAGSITNDATATGTPPAGPPVDSPPSTVTVPEPPAPAITVVKTASTTAITTVGQQVTYRFLVTNTGNVTLADATVTDTGFSGSGTLSAITCPAAAASLLPGAQVTCTATYRVTQADLDSGKLTNTATATGTPPSGTPPTSPPSTVTVPSSASGKLALVKSAHAVDTDGDGVIDAGDRIDWSLLVTNTASATVTGIKVSDPTAGAVTCPATSLAPGQSMTCTAPSHIVTAADVTAGHVRNTAVASGNHAGTPVTSPPSRAEVDTQTVTPPLASTGVSHLTLTVYGGIGLLLLGALMTLTGRTLRRRRA